MAALVSVQELQRIEGAKEREKKRACQLPSGPGKILKTWNVKHFSKVPGLGVENWIR